MRIIIADPGLCLTTPLGPHDVLLRTMTNLDRGAVPRRGSDIAEFRGSDHPAGLPYLVRIIPVFFVLMP